MNYSQLKNLRSVLLMMAVFFVAIPAVSASVQTTTPDSIQPSIEASVPGVQLLHADQTGVDLSIQVPAYEVLDLAQGENATCRQISLPGYEQTQEPGQLAVPVLVLMLGVPPQAKISAQAATQPANKVQSISDRTALCAAAPVDQAPDGETLLSEQSAPEIPPLVKVVDLGLMRSQRLVRLEVSPVQVDSASGEIFIHSQLDVHLQFYGDLSGEPVLEPDSYESMFAGQLLNYQSARQWRLASTDPPQLGSWTPPKYAYKILVDETGVYDLPYSDLSAAGLPVDFLDPRTFRVFNVGREIAITVTGEQDGSFDPGDVLSFYGEKVNTRYTDTNVYWLAYGGAAGLRMSDSPSLAGGDDATTFMASVFSEENLFYVSSLPKEPGYDHWYGRRIDAFGLGNPGHKDYIMTLDHVASGDHDAQVLVTLAGNTEGVHHLRLYVNGHEVHDDTWEGRTVYKGGAPYPQSYLNEGNNTLRIELANDTPGQPFDQAYVDWLQVDYQRTYEVDDDLLFFSGDVSGPQRYRLDSFTSADIELYNVTDPAQVKRVTGTSVTSLGGGAFRLEFGANPPGPRRYLALTAAQRLQPVDIVADMSSQLQSSAKGADYIIISHADFLEAVQPLAAQRMDQGMRVEVIDVQDVYDEFGYGMMSAEAIRDFLAFTYAQWQSPAPSYVLLVGDGTYDMRHYLPTSAPTFLPPYLAMVDFDLGETAADNRFVAISGDDILPDMHLGRLPANTVSETQVMVNKILQYETVTPDDAWTKNVLFVADNLEGGGGNFYDLSDAIADGYADPPTNSVKLLPEDYARTKTYMGQNCPTEDPSVVCRQEIIDTINTTGALMVSYIGHGTKTYWAREKLWDVTAIAELTNGDKTPIMLPMTCNEGYFHEAELGFESTSETGLRLPVGGSVASWAPTGFGLSTGHDYLERGLFLSVFHENAGRLGVATDAGKFYLIANAPPGRYLDLIDTFLLLGDPGLQLPVEESTPILKSTFLPMMMK